MKRLISKSGVIAYFDEKEATICFSDTKTMHPAKISYDENGKIVKITAEPIEKEGAVETNEIPNEEIEERTAIVNEPDLPILHLSANEFIMLYTQLAINDILKNESPDDYPLRPVA